MSLVLLCLHLLIYWDFILPSYFYLNHLTFLFFSFSFFPPKIVYMNIINFKVFSFFLVSPLLLTKHLSWSLCLSSLWPSIRSPSPSTTTTVGLFSTTVPLPIQVEVGSFQWNVSQMVSLLTQFISTHYLVQLILFS